MQTRGPQVPETARQGSDTRRDWSWVEASIWTERMLAALGNGVEGGRWFSLIDKVWRPATLRLAWQRVLRNRGAAGVDRQSVEAFGAHAERYLGELSDALRAGSYRPQPVKRVEIAKGAGQTRPLGIPTVKDRIVQTAVRLVIEPIFEAVFTDGSYGFRPGRGAKGALRDVDGLLQAGFTHVVDADLKSYFDTIPHAPLMARVAERISDGRVLALLQSWLEQDILSPLARWTPTQGTPQGAVISPLLANVYLHPLDQRMAALGFRMVRYADDFVVLCATAESAQAALAEIRAWVAAAGLTLHPEKTHVGDCRQPGQGFEFLGYRFESGRRTVRKKSWQKVRDRIRELTPRRSNGHSMAATIARLNPVLRGWYGYFKHAHRYTFGKLDGFVRRRLRAILRAYERRPGHGHTHADHQRWPNEFFASLGLFTLSAAHAAESRSR
jgi:RNA-directed DNA polymerase